MDFEIQPRDLGVTFYKNSNPYYADIAEYGPLTDEMQDKLFSKLDLLCPNRLDKDGPKMPPRHCMPVIEEIAKHLLKLVVSVARQFYRRHSKLQFTDLVQYGNEGLLKGIWKFDNSKGIKAITYVTYWIRQHIGRYSAEQFSTITVPIWSHDQHKHIQKFIDQHNEQPSIDEIAKHVGMSVRSTELIMRGCAAANTLSLDYVYDGEDSRRPADMSHFICEVQTNEPHDKAEQSIIRGAIEANLERLNPREEKIIRLYYGLTHDQTSLTLEEIARRMGVSRERIRQIKKEALLKLRRTDLGEYV